MNFLMDTFFKSTVAYIQGGFCVSHSGPTFEATVPGYYYHLEMACIMKV